MGLLHPYVCFISLLFILLVIPTVLGLGDSFRNYIKDYTFIPRWKTGECGGQENWAGPTGYPIDGGGNEFPPPWNYVGYVEEGFTAPVNVDSLERDASLLTETAGHPELNMKAPADNKDNLLTYRPNGPAPIPEDYELLSDVLKSTPDSGISCVNSRSCYATNFERLQEKTGNFRQFTNNFKHGYPDSCSSPFQELVLTFYKSPGMTVDVPKNCM